MFSLIWRFFPGPGWLRVFAMLAVLVGLIYVLVTWGYPWVATLIPEPQSTVDLGLAPFGETVTGAS